MRGATYEKLRNAKIKGISIHAPLAGRDEKEKPETKPESISIHAPLALRDWFNRYVVSRYLNFNPRAPCGARLHNQIPWQ